MKLSFAVICSGPTPGASITPESGDIGQYKVTYTEAGSYLFRCTVTDSDGLTASDDLTVEVQFGEIFCMKVLIYL